MYPRVLAAVLDGWVAVGRISTFIFTPALPARVFAAAEDPAAVGVRLIGVRARWDVPQQPQQHQRQRGEGRGRRTGQGKGGKASQIAPGGAALVAAKNKGGDGRSILAIGELRVGAGEFAVVVGAVGSFKTSLLSAVLGEMEVEEGRLDVVGSVAYVPQSPFLLNATVRFNITFGQAYDERRYNETIHACCLQPDFAMFKQGDMTEIGERGITVSGGQKMRIGLARAVYQDAQVCVINYFSLYSVYIQSIFSVKVSLN